MSGFTANYIKVTVPYDETLTGRIVPVRLQRVLPLGVVEAALCDPMDKMG